MPVADALQHWSYSQIHHATVGDQASQVRILTCHSRLSTLSPNTTSCNKQMHSKT